MSTPFDNVRLTKKQRNMISDLPSIHSSMVYREIQTAFIILLPESHLIRSMSCFRGSMNMLELKTMKWPHLGLPRKERVAMASLMDRRGKENKTSTK